MTDEAMQRVRVRGRRVGLEPMRGRVVLDDELNAAVVVTLVAVRKDNRSAEGGERDEQHRAQQGAPRPEPVQHAA